MMYNAQRPKLAPAVQSWIVSARQLEIDTRLVLYDIWGTAAHVVMLCRCGIITRNTAAKLLQALRRMEKEYAAGRFRLNPDKGAQLSLEARLVELAGEKAGLSAHTARSRNDQVAVTELLYLRQRTLSVVRAVSVVCAILLRLAARHSRTVFPGYTHMQPAKPTSFGHWCLAYADALLRCLDGMESACRRYDLCPLGAVESFGTSWPIDRELTARLLGFSGVWENPQDAITSRGMFQLALLTGLEEITLVASRMATDLLFYSTFECGTVRLGEDVARRLHPVTGSSVMAQKRNPDVLELIRATAPELCGLRQTASGILARLPSGYNRDSREIKEYVELGLDKTGTMLAALERALATLTVDSGRARELVEKNYSLTTDLADYLARTSGAPYRLVYKIVGAVVDRLIAAGKPLAEVTAEELNREAEKHGLSFCVNARDLHTVLDPNRALELRRHTGGTSASAFRRLLTRTRKDISLHQAWADRQARRYRRAYDKTWFEAERLM